MRKGLDEENLALFLYQSDALPAELQPLFMELTGLEPVTL